MSYFISSSATSDLPTSYYEANDVKLLFFPYYIDDVMYTDNYFEEYGLEKFYEYIPNAKSVKTSQPSIGVIGKYFEALLKQGKDVLHVELSSGLSGTYQSARMAALELNDKYPNKVIVVDSLAATGIQGAIVERMVLNRNNGLTIDENFADLEEYKMILHTRFYVTDVRMLVKGGRISPAVGKICEVANIVPCIWVTADGKLDMYKKCLGNKKALLETIKDLEKYARNGRDYDGVITIAHSAFESEVEEMKKLVSKRFPKASEVRVTIIGPVIGSHTGPHAIGLMVEGEKRGY